MMDTLSIVRISPDHQHYFGNSIPIDGTEGPDVYSKLSDSISHCSKFNWSTVYIKSTGPIEVVDLLK